MRRYLIAGNWKMNTTRGPAEALARAVAGGVPGEGIGVDVMVAPPFPYLIPVAGAIAGSGVTLGAQDAYFEPPGAFTGEVAVEMLKDVGCRSVIVGHSERRHVLGETDEVINGKIRAVLAAGLVPVFCVGELLEERTAGRTEEVLDRQLDGGLDGVSAEEAGRVVIAYEPVWAIGTGVNATPEQAQSAHSHLRNRVAERYNSGLAGRLRILYGGSVKADNAESLLGQPDVDGALVGGASLKAETFLPIVEAAVRLST
ncbi:MAG TPA: triose-phosphate isomerase [Planctomycetaceae bacterium]|nr:triose-phosphate isomerase [Planctomycetaceae bacterium]